MIGRLRAVAFDAPDPVGLAAFYTSLTGWTQTHVEDDWITLAPRDGWWPDPAHPQRAHFDVLVGDVDAAEQAAFTVGATRLPG